jgi:hypothetical protein
MAEAIVSIGIVGVMFVAVVGTLGAARAGEYKLAERARGLALAQDLTAEILQQAYADPELGLDSFLLGEAKIGDGSRSLWDDVDDYDGWSASPPQHKDGTEMTDFPGWERSVEVFWVNPSDLSQIVGSNQGVKQVIVTVRHEGVPVASLLTFRASVSSRPWEA